MWATASLRSSLGVICMVYTVASLSKIRARQAILDVWQDHPRENEVCTMHTLERRLQSQTRHGFWTRKPGFAKSSMLLLLSLTWCSLMTVVAIGGDDLTEPSSWRKTSSFLATQVYCSMHPIRKSVVVPGQAKVMERCLIKLQGNYPTDQNGNWTYERDM